MIRPAAPVAWPEGKRAAACFTFDVDAESPILFSAPAMASRMSLMSHQAYGPLTGVPRLLRLLGRREVRATFFVPGYTADRYPDVIRAIVDGGHEIAHHGYLHERVVDADPTTESGWLDRGLDALQRVAGVRPTGYRAPMWELNYHSPQLLADRNFLYDSSLMDADVPYELRVDETRSLVEIPIQWALDDWEQYCYLPDFSGGGYIASPSVVLETWSLEFEAIRAEAGCFVLTNHPFLSGRPSRAAALEHLIERVTGCDDVWVATMSEVAEHVRALGLRPRDLPRPLLD